VKRSEFLELLLFLMFVLTWKLR